MTRLLFFCLSLLVPILTFGQTKYEVLRWDNWSNQYVLDFYTNNTTKALDSLSTSGFYTLKVDSVKADKIYINKGKNYKKIWVKNESIFHNSEFNPTFNLDSILSIYQQKNEKDGFAFSNIQILNRGSLNDEQKIELILNKGSQRRIDNVKAIGYPKLSKGYIKYGLGLKKNKIYSDEVLAQASRVLQSTNYIQELQTPQTLFRPDSTIVYIYPKKIKSNNFDGILGFGNDDNGDFKLNGNILLELNNVFNGLEQIRLNWIGTANKNTTLDIGVKLPYLFKSPIGSETQFKLFKQDSVFLNIDLNERLFYQLNPNASIGANLSYHSSNYLLDTENLTSAYDDYTKTGIGLSYDYFVKHPLALMEGKAYFKIFGSSLTRKETNFSWFEDVENKTTQQFEVGLSTYRLFELSPKHHLKIEAKFSGLLDKENNYSENELYRIGGFGSIRGFNEESILANMYGIGSLDYRFLANEGFYVSLFSDYAFIDNKRLDLNTSFLSFGSGLSFLTKIGIFNISYAVGKTENTPFDFKDSKIHFGILSQF